MADTGIRVVVVTMHNQAAYKLEFVEGIEVHYLPVAYDNRFGFYKRSLAFIKYLLGVMRMSGKFQDVNICYAISVPLTVGIAGVFLRFFNRIPYVFEVGDLWPEAPVQLGYVKNPILKKLLFLLEKQIYQKALSIVALSPSIRQHIQPIVPGKKIHLIPNMSDTDFFRMEEKDQYLEQKINVEGKIVISYIGAVGYANGLDYMLEIALASQHAQFAIHFIICGEGAMLESLKNSATKLDLENLTFIPFQNRQGVKDIMSITDISLISYRPVAVLETGSPNKYFDGLAAGKLIMINFGGWIKEEIEMMECGVSLDPLLPKDFLKKIDPFLKDILLLKKYQRNARMLAEGKYSRQIIGEHFVKILKTL